MKTKWHVTAAVEAFAAGQFARSSYQSGVVQLATESDETYQRNLFEALHLLAHKKGLDTAGPVQ